MTDVLNAQSTWWVDPLLAIVPSNISFVLGSFSSHHKQLFCPKSKIENNFKPDSNCGEFALVFFVDFRLQRNEQSKANNKNKTLCEQATFRNKRLFVGFEIR